MQNNSQGCEEGVADLIIGQLFSRYLGHQSFSQAPLAGRSILGVTCKRSVALPLRRNSLQLWRRAPAVKAKIQCNRFKLWPLGSCGAMNPWEQRNVDTLRNGSTSTGITRSPAVFSCDKAPLQLALSVCWSVGLSVCNAFVRRSTRRTLLAYLALFSFDSLRKNHKLTSAASLYGAVTITIPHAWFCVFGPK